MQRTSSNLSASSAETREKYRQSYEKAMAGLNPEQRTAVDAIDGPVMVVAGPGTGKTQILATRIAKLIHDHQIDAQNILCLTFSESAATNMLKRLLSIIGPDAHKLSIHTFHGFCNKVIQENLDYFGQYRQLEKLTDLEEIELFDDMLNELPDDSPIKRLRSNNSYETGRLKNLFSYMDQEYVSSAEINYKMQSYLEECQDDKQNSEYYYKRKTKHGNPGEPKAKLQKLVRQTEELKAAADLHTSYVERKRALGRYTYSDMINWVIKAFEENAQILASYQEQYQYILVDEYQDTNGSQNALLNQLLSIWGEKADVFVVGDDDQAIFKFQGANLKNIGQFYQQYQPKTIVLQRNYRSSQLILNAADRLIQHNSERLVNDADLGLSKELLAEGPNKKLTVEPNIFSFTTEEAEQAYLVNLIHQKHQNGERLDRLAVIYAKHEQADDMIQVLEKKGIPINVRKRINILNLALVKNLINILTYLASTSDPRNERDDLLVQIMHYSFFGVKALDIARLSIYIAKQEREKNRDARQSWRFYLSDPGIVKAAGLSDPESVISLFDQMDQWIKSMHEDTLQVFFHRLINEAKILQYIFNTPEKAWHLQVLTTLMDMIKVESNKTPDWSLTDFLSMIEKYKANGIKIELNKSTSGKDGVHFLTAYAAKGLEFEEVYIIGCRKDKWDSVRKSTNQYKLPPELISNEQDIQDKRRLFFVAMTRAEQKLVMTYPEVKKGGKEVTRSIFLDEILEDTSVEVQNISVADEIILDFEYDMMLQSNQSIALIDHDLIDSRLVNYKLSVTHLNKYLRCPLAFYFENILQVPSPRTSYMGYGKAVHKALESYVLAMKDNQATLSDLLDNFHRSMKSYHSHFTKQEYQDFATHGEKMLKAYHDEILTTLDDSVTYISEHKVDAVAYRNVPLKGELDRIDIHGSHIVVHDYKTSNVTSAKTKAKLRPPNQSNADGGDYWRQMVFYRILADADYRLSKPMTKGVMNFVEADKDTGEYLMKEYDITPDQIQQVGDQIVDTMEKIKTYQFTDRCRDKDCQWCAFVENDFVQTVTISEDEYEPDVLEIEEFDPF